MELYQNIENNETKTNNDMEEYPLIANSGIQLYTCDIELDLASSPRQLFHEWFDEE